jgi:hypothetical protein
MEANNNIESIYKIEKINTDGGLLVLGLGSKDDVPSKGVYRLAKKVTSLDNTEGGIYITKLNFPKSIPFVEVERNFESQAPDSNNDSRGKGPRVTLISLNALLIVNKWNFTLTCCDDGTIRDGMSYRTRDGWEGWVIEVLNGGDTCFLTRNKNYGKFVLAIDDTGAIKTTQNRVLAGWEEFEFKVYNKVVTFRRVKKPRYYLGMDKNGKMTTSLECDLDGNGGWKIE